MSEGRCKRDEEIMAGKGAKQIATPPIYRQCNHSSDNQSQALGIEFCSTFSAKEHDASKATQSNDLGP